MEKFPKVSREHVGGGDPYEKAAEKSKKLSQKTAEVEEEMRAARSLGDVERAKKLEERHERLLEEQRETLQKAAETKQYGLEKLEETEDE